MKKIVIGIGVLILIIGILLITLPFVQLLPFESAYIGAVLAIVGLWLIVYGIYRCN